MDAEKWLATEYLLSAGKRVEKGGGEGGCYIHDRGPGNRGGLLIRPTVLPTGRNFGRITQTWTKQNKFVSRKNRWRKFIRKGRLSLIYHFMFSCESHSSYVKEDANWWHWYGSVRFCGFTLCREPFQNGLNTRFTVAEFLDQCGRKILGRRCQPLKA